VPSEPCEPQILCGARGWLAVSPPDYPYRIGVVGLTEDEARQRFSIALAEWEELHGRAEPIP
jgi:hypothetical protein